VTVAKSELSKSANVNLIEHWVRHRHGVVAKHIDTLLPVALWIAPDMAHWIVIDEIQCSVKASKDNQRIDYANNN
jgi:hypothetical protein